MSKNKIQTEIQRLNEKWAFVNLKGKACVLHDAVDPETNHKDVEFFAVESFHQYFANQKIETVEKAGDGKKSKKAVPISKIWFQAPERRHYEGVVFDPSRIGNDDGYYNLFRGISVKPKSGDWGLMFHHIKEVISDGDDVVFDYVLAWLTDLFQNPGGRRPGVALVLRGDQGVGKGNFASNVGKIIDPHFAHVTSPRHFSGRFNSHLKDKLLVFVDEGIWGGDKQVEGIIKGYITEESVIIEPKGLNSFSIKNHMRFIIAGNNDWLVPVGQGDRRMFILDVNSRYQGDHKYFADIARQMNNGGREAMLHDLMGYKPDIDLRNFPRTGAHTEHLMRSWSPIHHFWYEKLKEGSLTPDEIEWTGSVPVKFLYEEYVGYCRAMNIRHIKDDSIFAKDLRKLCPELRRTRPRIEGGVRQYNYELPNLDKCRYLFEKKMKVTLATAWD
jgi:hypothetical protein